MTTSGINVIRVGNGKRNVVFLHGWGMDAKCFLPVAEKLHGCSCFLVDLWGFGDSPSPDESGWTVENYADGLHAFFVNENIADAVVVGHSFGGRIALVLAEKYPMRVGKLFLISSAGLRRFSFKRFFKVLRYKLCKKLGRPTQKGSVDYENCSLSMKNTFVKVVNQDLSAYARKVKQPTFLYWGSSDTETPLWMAKRLHKLMKNSYLNVVEGGHFAFFSSNYSHVILECFIDG